MTTLVLAALALLFAVAIYLAGLCGRRLERPGDFLDGGSGLPAWVLMFAGAGVLVGGLGLRDHLLLATMYGLQSSHVARGLVLAALCGAMVHKRLWIAARATRKSSLIDIVSDYYGGVALIAVTMMFAVPFAAQALGEAADLMTAATAGAIPRRQAVFTLAIAMFLVSTIGGRRGVTLAVAARAFLLLALLLFAPLFMAAAFYRLSALASGPSAIKGVLADQMPGVMQYSAGIGKDVAAGGMFTTLTILAAGASLIGLALSPAMGLLATTTRVRTGLAFQQVWMVAGLATGALILTTPVLAANLIAGDVVRRYLIPDLTGDGQRLAARVALAALYAGVVLAAAYAPLSSAILGAATVSSSAQLPPVFIGPYWAPWISREAVVCGLLFGELLVIFTEPPGLVAFEGLFLDLPWGRWPLTIHSTAWGLAFNVAAYLLVSLFTKAGPERERRERLHAVFRNLTPHPRAGSAAPTAKWSLSLIWTFLALGPSAILGNTFFSKPMFAEGDVALGVPSLWVWQVVSWFVGLLLTWWLAYRGRMDGRHRRNPDRQVRSRAVRRPVRRPARSALAEPHDRATVSR